MAVRAPPRECTTSSDGPGKDRRRHPRQGDQTLPGKGEATVDKIAGTKKESNPELNKIKGRNVHNGTRATNKIRYWRMDASPNLSEELGVWECLRSLNFILSVKLNSL